MRVFLRSTALGLALAAGASAAHAQTVIDPPLVTVPATAVPMQTTQTTVTTRTVRPAPRSARRQIVTTRTVTRQRVVPAPTVVARTVTTAPRPLYDEVAPAPVVTTSDDDYAPRLYDEVTTAPAVAPAPVVRDQYTTPFFYRYVYEPDRILVIDPNTGVAVQAIPR
jgi:hypothetical protein